MTEREIYIKLIKHKLGWVNPAIHIEFKKIYGHLHSQATDDELYDFAKKKLYPLMNENDEVIPRSQWDLDSLVGVTEKQLFHPHYDLIKKHIFKHHKRQHDTLVIFECSNSKPYKENRILKQYATKYKDLCDFACISNPGIIPLEFSNYYPYRYDEWDHFEETQEIEDLYVKVNTERFFEYVNHFGYKKVIVFMQHPKPRRLFDEMADTRGIEVINVIDEDFTNQVMDEYLPRFKGSRGLIYSRLIGLKPVREKFDDIVKKMTT